MSKKYKKNILDFGCGHGYNTYILSKKYNAFGVDLSDNVNFCKHKYPNIDFRESINNKIDFPDFFFDVVYAIEVLEHVDDLNAIILELTRVLKSGGKFIISIPYWKSEKFLLKLRPTYFDEIHHVRIFYNNDLELLLKNNYSLLSKKRKWFLSHLEIIYLFKRKSRNKTQISIGNWRDSVFGVFIHIFLGFFSENLFNTPLKYCPIWIVTLPIGMLIDFIGNKIFPKSVYYEFIKR